MNNQKYANFAFDDIKESKTDNPFRKLQYQNEQSKQNIKEQLNNNTKNTDQNLNQVPIKNFKPHVMLPNGSFDKFVIFFQILIYIIVIRIHTQYLINFGYLNHVKQRIIGRLLCICQIKIKGMKFLMDIDLRHWIMD